MPKIKTDPIDLSGFDYNNLQGESFQKYLAIQNSLPANNEYDFEQYMASGIFKFRINENTGEKEEYLFGIKINSNGPVNTTKVEAQYIRDLNNQIFSKLGDSNSRYYLLKK